MIIPGEHVDVVDRERTEYGVAETGAARDASDDELAGVASRRAAVVVTVLRRGLRHTRIRAAAA